MAYGDEWDPKLMFEKYLYDYLVKKGLHATAETFKNEAGVSNDSVLVDTPDGFLHEWWSFFYDVYMSRQGRDAAETSSQGAQASRIDQLAQLANQQRSRQQMANPRIADLMTQPSLNLSLSAPAMAAIASSDLQLERSRQAVQQQRVQENLRASGMSPAMNFGGQPKAGASNQGIRIGGNNLMLLNPGPSNYQASSSYSLTQNQLQQLWLLTAQRQQQFLAGALAGNQTNMARQETVYARQRAGNRQRVSQQPQQEVLEIGRRREWRSSQAFGSSSTDIEALSPIASPPDTTTTSSSDPMDENNH